MNDNDILLATLPAALVLIATLGARFLEHYLQMKRETSRQKLEKEREIRDARRQYREGIARPVREALDKVQVTLSWRDLVKTINKAESQGIPLKPETIRDKEILEEIQRMKEVRNLRKTLTEFNPLTAAINNEETKKTVQQAFASAVLSEETLSLLKITEKDIEQKFRLAYQKLEDFITLAD